MYLKIYCKSPSTSCRTSVLMAWLSCPLTVRRPLHFLLSVISVMYIYQNCNVTFAIFFICTIKTALHFSLQEAQKRMKIKKPPNILVIHLKRFKYIEQLQRYKKLSYRVVFPLELKLLNTVDNSDLEYSLFAVVVHVGSGPNHGHYISLVKSHNHWLFFDDENVEMTDESMVQAFFGSPQEFSGNTDNGYILFYESLAEKS